MMKLKIVAGLPYVIVGQHRIYQNVSNEMFILEKYIGTQEGRNKYSVVDGYDDLVEAIETAKQL